MKYTKLKICTTLLLGAGLTGIQAQTSINTGGGNASGSGGSASYSVGQIVYKTHTGISGSVSQDIQQPYEISVVTELEEARDIILSATAYPNPASDYLTLELAASALLSIQSMTYQLYDIQGKLLQSEQITGKQTRIIMSHLVPATYFICVTNRNQPIKEFKIVKR